MRALLVLAILGCPLLVGAAELKWHEIGVGGQGETQTTNIGPVSITLQTRDVPNADFKEDHLVLTVHIPGKPEMEEWFASSYGQAGVAIHGDLLFLKYGVGRGTCAREHHVKILKLSHRLHELADVHSSFYIDRNRKKKQPEFIEYQVRAQVHRAYTTVTFRTPDRIPGIPSEKIVTFNNED
jgi:hypothetical protein